MRPSDVLAHLLIVNFSKTEINSSEGEGWQDFQRKKRRLEGESEMGSTVICIQQDASNYQRLNQNLNPRRQPFFSQTRISCAEASPFLRLAARFGH